MDGASENATWRADLLELQATLLAHFKRSLTDDRIVAQPQKVDACRYCWGKGHHWQWKSRREYQAALVTGDLDDPDLSDRGGFGYRPSRGPNPDCPECDGCGTQDTLQKLIASLPQDLVQRLRSISVNHRGASLTVFDACDPISDAIRFVAERLGSLKGEVPQNDFAAALRAISARGSSAPLASERGAVTCAEERGVQSDQ